MKRICILNLPKIAMELDCFKLVNIHLFQKWRLILSKCSFPRTASGFRACLQGERVTQASGLPEQAGYPTTHTFPLFFFVVLTRQPGLPGYAGYPICVLVG